MANLSQVQELIDSRITPLINRIDSLESSLNTLVTSQTNLTNMVSSTNNTVSELTSSVNSFVQATNTRFETVNELISSSKSSQGGNGENGGGTSSAPVTPIVNEEPISPNTSCWGEKLHTQDVVESGTRPLPEDALKTGETFNKKSPSNVNFASEITPLVSVEQAQDIKSKTVAADLESLILPNGKIESIWLLGTMVKVLMYLILPSGEIILRLC